MKKDVLDWNKSIIMAIFIAICITTFIAKPTVVKGESMHPTLEEYDYLIIDRITYKLHNPKQGDIIVFKSHLMTMDGKKKNLIKRVIGVDGDKVRVIDGNVYVNDQLLEEDYINGHYTLGEIDIIVPKDRVFVIGDNREENMSIDSRDSSVGFVEIDSILGKMLIRLYPFSKIGKVY